MRCAFLRIFCAFFPFWQKSAFLRIFAHFLRIFCFFAPIFFIFHPFELKIIALFFLREGNFFYGAGKGTSINTSGRPTFRVEKIKKNQCNIQLCLPVREALKRHPSIACFLFYSGTQNGFKLKQFPTMLPFCGFTSFG